MGQLTPFYEAATHDFHGSTWPLLDDGRDGSGRSGEFLLSRPAAFRQHVACSSQVCPRSPPALWRWLSRRTTPFRPRLLRKKSHHFPARIRPFRIGITAPIAAPRPSVSSTMHHPMFGDGMSVCIAMDRALVGAAVRFPALFS